MEYIPFERQFSMPLTYFSTKPDTALPSFCHHLPITPECILVDSQKKMEIALSIQIPDNVTHFTPSLTLLHCQEYSFQFSLTTKESNDPAYLTPCGESCSEFYERYKTHTKSSSIRSEIDLFNFIKPANTITLNVSLKSLKSINLKNLKIFISYRGEQGQIDLSPVNAVFIPISSFSQMSQNNDIKNRICSPTSSFMVLNYFNDTSSFNELLSDMYNREEDMYGVWPQAIYAASKRDVQGFVGYINDSKEITELLESGLPIIASIQHHGDLPGSPLSSTNGHLVVIKGIKSNSIIVNDPAIDNALSVEIEYPIKEFLNSWSKSGFAYYCFFK